MATGGGGQPTSGHILRLSNTGISGGAIGQVGTSPLSPLRASQMDRKVDDGNPISGSVLANYGVANDDYKTGSTYIEQERRKNCVLYFMVDR